MNRGICLITAVALAGCMPPDELAPEPEDTDIVLRPSDCDAQTVTVSPQDQGAEVFFLDPVVVTTTLEDTVDIVVVDDAGAVVEGETAVDETGLVWTFSHDGLAPSTGYTVEVTYCAGSPETTFTTSDYGTPVPVVEDLIGRTYLMEVQDGRITRPAGVGDLLAGALAAWRPLFEVRETDDGEGLQILAAVGIDVGDEVVQDPCAKSTFLPADVALDLNPQFEVYAEQFTYVWDEFEINLEEATIGGVFSSDGREVAGVFLTATLDTRPIVPFFNPVGDDYALCEYLLTFGEECVPCGGDGTQRYCATMTLGGATGRDLPGITLVPRTQEEVDANPACDAP